VKQLEDRLGTKLFVRRNRRLRLSSEAALRTGPARGTLQLGALESVAATRLPPILVQFHRAYPDVRVELEAWLGGANVVPERVMEFGSYHAIVACVAAGTGIAIVPRSVLRVTGAERDVSVSAPPRAVATAHTCLVWRQGHRSSVLEALQGRLPAPRR